MADNTILNTGSGGDTISTDDVGAGVKVQRMKVQYGVDGSATDVSATNPLPVVNGYVGSGTIAGNAQSVAVNVLGMAGASFYIPSGLAATVKPQYTIDGTNWIDTSFYLGTALFTQTTRAVAAAALPGQIDYPSGAQQVRILTTAYTSGSVTVTLVSSGPVQARLVPTSGGQPSSADTCLAVGISSGANSIQLTDGTHSPVAAKASGTAPATTDIALVTTGSPNGATFLKDNNAFTDGTTYVAMAGYILDDTPGTALTENDAAAARIDSKRAQMFVLEDATTRGQKASVSSGGALKVDNSAVTQPVSGTVSATCSGTVAATQSGTWTCQPGNTPNTTPWLMKINDGTNSCTVKAASTLAVSTDTAVVVAVRDAVTATVTTATPTAQVWKSFAVTTAQTGTAVWTPGGGKKVVITSYSLGSGGTTAGKVTLWFGAGGGSPDTTYTEGTDQPLVKLTFTPSATATPGAIVNLDTPIVCANADFVLRLTTSAGLTLDGVVYGYEA